MYLSIVIPVYNSSKIIPKLIRQLNSSINKKIIKNFEIIFINDFSKDNSWQVIKFAAKNNSKIKGINLLKNYGQHSAIFAGLKFAKGKKIITMDDDLQHPTSSIMSICKKLDKHELCYTLYLNRKHKLWKKVISYCNNIYSSFLFDKPFKIYHSSFRGFSSNLNKKIIKHKKPVIFLDSLLLKHTKNICTVDVLHKKRFDGESNYNLTNLFRLWFDMIINYHFLPLRFGTFVGIFSKTFVYLITIFDKKKIYQYKISEKTF